MPALASAPTFPRSAVVFLAAFIVAGSGGRLAAQDTGALPQVPPIALPRAAAPITLDGDLSDPGWQGAGRIDTFYETSPGDNTPPPVKTTAWVTYDEQYLYIGVECDDPAPQQIRAPYVDRDQVIGTQDNVAVFLDPRNDRRSAIELRINARGIQADAMYNDANGNEDFSPDFFYDTAAKITARGWSGEFRIPFSSLRYPPGDPQTWGILIWRNYPRDFRYAFHSAPLPRGTPCFICHAHELTDIRGLPTSRHFVVAPYATANRVETKDPDDASWDDAGVDGEAGIDVKWNPTADTTIDATVNPDFSQIESDVAQISVNERFALFFPEKRPFFLEGVDLIDTPIPAVYTRTVTSPRWGLRGTGKWGASAYTLLVTEDRGGGLVILPGPDASDFAPQEFKSQAVIGRLRRDFGGSFAGLLVTDREVNGGGYNRVFGPDFQWRPNAADSLTGQFLWSATENPDRPDLSPVFDGSTASSHAARLVWDHQTSGYDWRLLGQDFGEDFRADNGFVPQVGMREGTASVGLRRYPEGLLSFVRVYGVADVQRDQQGEALSHDYFPGLLALGKRNLNLGLELHQEEARIGGQQLERRYLFFFVQVDPSRRIARLGLNGTLGEQFDFANARVGDGPRLNLTATLRPEDHLELQLDASRQWLDVSVPEGSGRLFTAHVERLKATYVFSPRQLLRLIGQYVATDREPELYGEPVPPQDGNFTGSLLYAFKVNWQTVLFVGYGDERTLDDRDQLRGTNRTLFVKISYALQR